MLRRIDAALIERMDRLTTKLQRRGVLLTSLHVVAAETTLVLAVAASVTANEVSTISLVLDGVVWGGWAVVYRRWASQNKDYPESKRIMERLNAKALHYADSENYIRWMWLCLLPIGAVAHGIDMIIDPSLKNCVHQALLILGVISPTIMWYLNPCTFLGPGHFAKEKQEKFISDPITLRG